MKKIFFLIGFLVIVGFSQAQCADICTAMTDAQFSVTVTSTDKDVQLVGVYIGSDSSSEASSAALAACCGIGTKTSYGYYFTYNPNVNGLYFNVWCYRDDCGHVYYAFWNGGSGDLESDCAGPTAGDSDGDGIPDNLDANPDSTDYYQFRIMTNFFDQDGNWIGQIIETSSGDYRLISDLTAEEIDAGMAIGAYTSTYVNSSDWIDSTELTEDGGGGAGSGIYTESLNTSSGLTDSQSSSLVSGSSQNVESDSSIGTGTASAEGDTDSQLTGKITDNTAQTVDGLAKIGGYLNQINQNVSKLNDTVASSGTSDEGDLGSDSDNSTAQSAATDMQNVDVGATYNSTNFSGNLTAGEDYEDMQPLDEQSWFTSFVESNPYKTALEGSGFSCTNAVCEITVAVPAPINKTVKASLCRWETEFENAGIFLLSFVTLSGFILLVWK
jgi:hypothetical protein